MQEELQEMMIGRADEQGTSCVAQASQCRIHVWGLFAEPIWASGHHAASKAGHMTAVAPPSNSVALPLHPRGRLHMQQSLSEPLIRLIRPTRTFSAPWVPRTTAPVCRDQTRRVMSERPDLVQAWTDAKAGTTTLRPEDRPWLPST